MDADLPTRQPRTLECRADMSCYTLALDPLNRLAAARFLWSPSEEDLPRTLESKPWLDAGGGLVAFVFIAFVLAPAFVIPFLGGGQMRLHGGRYIMEPGTDLRWAAGVLVILGALILAWLRQTLRGPAERVVITRDGVELKRRKFIGYEHWREPLAGYRGVAPGLRTWRLGRDRHSRVVWRVAWIIMLVHPDARKNVPLACGSWTEPVLLPDGAAGLPDAELARAHARTAQLAAGLGLPVVEG